MNRAMSLKYFIYLFRLSAHCQCAFFRCSYCSLCLPLTAFSLCFPSDPLTTAPHTREWTTKSDPRLSWVTCTSVQRTRERWDVAKNFSVSFITCCFHIAAGWSPLRYCQCNYISCRCFAFKASNGVIPPVLAVDWMLHCDIRHEGKTKKKLAPSLFR